jgi:DNA-binding MarR family transcriptional regulator
LQRVRSTQDRRQNCLKLTKKGEGALKEMLSFVAKHERKISSRLSNAERKQLISMLMKLG